MRNGSRDEQQRGKTIGGRIRELRKSAGMTQEQLADRLQLENKSSVSKYELDKTTPTPEQFVCMAKIFGTSTDYILSGQIPERGTKLLQAEKILQSMTLDKTLDAAITMLLTLRALE